jgi:hypothetical protein
MPISHRNKKENLYGHGPLIISWLYTHPRDGAKMTETGILNALPGALKANGPKDEGYRVFFLVLFFFFFFGFVYQTFSLMRHAFMCVVPTSPFPSR